jgi:hypothetical protein
MATETGVVKSITADRTSAQIIKDANLSEITTKDVLIDLVIEDGVEFDDNGGEADNVNEITKVDVKGALTEDETKMLQALTRSINKRGGGGGIKLTVKTKK